MKPFSLLAWVTAGVIFSGVQISAAPLPNSTVTIIHAVSPQGGKIDPRLFGNFIELLDDVTPGIWSEMLNDRSFEGVTPLANWCYFDGAPNVCDRQWDTNATWSLDSANPFNGAHSVQLSATRSQPANLIQSGLAVKKGMTYSF